jgi:hypothetical protein
MDPPQLVVFRPGERPPVQHPNPPDAPGRVFIRAIPAIIDMQPTIIASGITASSTHQLVSAATTTTAAATSTSPNTEPHRPKHIMVPPFLAFSLSS